MLPKLLAAIVGVLVVVTASAWFLAGRDVPPLDGQRALPGLTDPVEVLFDGVAVPHVYAREEADVWLAGGYLHGRERLWQMEVYRRAAAGRLSDMFGKATLPLDRTFLRLGLRRAASAEWQKTTGSARVALERYAVGVNHAIAEATGLRLPLEFRLLGVRPEPWTPIDSLSVAQLMAYRLRENRRGELVRGLLVSRLGAPAAALLPDPPAWAPTIVPSSGSVVPTLSHSQIAPRTLEPRTFEPRIFEPRTFEPRTRELRTLEPGTPEPGTPEPRTPELRTPEPGTLPGTREPLNPGTRTREPENPRTREPLRSALSFLFADRASGSNSWVVSGQRTATGRPLLANDPHLAVELPSVWYEAHFITGAMDVAGVTIPGAPFVVIGHNRTIAWGITNAGADVEDFYEEQVDLPKRRYLTPSGWAALRAETFDIRVRGDDPEKFEVLSTKHGPLATEDEWADPMFDPSRDARDPKARWLALRAAEGDGTGATFESIGRAQSWSDFLAAVARGGQPPLSFVYADTSGNIGYAMSGRLPIRGGWDGGTPVPGSSGSEWRGFVDPAALPRVLNPPSGQIVSANNEIDRGQRLTRDWVSPFRAARIEDLLGDRRGFDVEAFARIQNDVTTRGADPLLEAIDASLAATRGTPIEPQIREVLDRLRLWDRRADGRSIVSLYEAFEQALWTRTFADEMEPAVFRPFYEYAARERYAGLWAVIGDPQSRWFDDIATLDHRETRNDIVIGAAADAVTALRRKFGDDEKAWSWDRLHAVTFDHAISAGGWPLPWWFSRGPFPIGGDDTTINKTAVDRRRPYRTVELPSYRLIIDVGGWDNSRGVITTGQSGHPQSPHYFDQHALWQRGEYHAMPFSRSAVDAARQARLLLVPE